MKLLKLFFIMSYITCFIIFANCTNNYTYEYYFQIKIDDSYTIVGKYPIKDIKTDSLNCYRFTYDKNKTLKEISYFRNGKLSIDNRLNVAKVIIKYGNENELWHYYGVDGKPTPNNDHVFINKKVYNFNDNSLFIYNYNKEKRIMKDKYGIAWELWKLNEKGLVETSFHFNETGDTIIDYNGFCVVLSEYDNNDNLAKLSNFDKNGRLLADEDGIAIRYCKHDSFKNITEMRNYDVNNKLIKYTVADRYSFPIVKAEYDEYGNRIAFKYCNENEIVRQKILLDENLNSIERSYYNDKGIFSIDQDLGYARIEYEYNEDGEFVLEHFYGVDERIIYSAFGDSSTIKYIYNTEGNIVEHVYIDTNEVIHHTVLLDENGNEIEKRYFDEEGNLKDYGSWGNVAIIKKKYDEHGNKIETSYYGADKKLRENDEEGDLAIIRNKYNDKGQITEFSFYGDDGKLKCPSDTGIDCAIYRVEYDENDNISVERYYNEKGELSKSDKRWYSIQEYKYDKNGKIIEIRYCDNDGELKEGEYGYAITQHKYDNNGTIIRVIYLDKDEDFLFAKKPR